LISASDIMQIASKLAVACAILAAQTDSLRKSARRQADHAEAREAELPRYEDTFAHDDDQSVKQLEQGQEHRLETGPIGDVTAAAEAPSLPMAQQAASTATPNCANRGEGQRVVSMADQHGDFDGLVLHMHKLGLLSRVPTKSSSTWSGIWAGGDTIFVQTGDILDRGPDGKAMYKFLWNLQDQAPRGSVVLLTGNHELMVLQGDIRYVTNIDFCTYTRDNCGGSPPRSASYCSTCCNYDNGKCSSSGSGCLNGNCEFLQAWDKNGEMGAEMRKRFREGKMKLAYEANGVVFTHAGLASSIWGKIGSRNIDDLNNRTADLFSSSNGKQLWNSGDIVAATDRENGPMWSRICYLDWYTAGARRRSSGGKAYLSSAEEKRVENGRCATIAKSLQMIGAKRMVIGHCPQGPSGGSAGVRTTCSGQFIEADTYMSTAYAGSRSKATYNMAAIEFYSKDRSGRVWAVYAGQNKCRELPEIGSDDGTSCPSTGLVKTYSVGDRVQAVWTGDGNLYDATIAANLGSGRYKINWDDGDTGDREKTLDQLCLVSRGR